MEDLYTKRVISKPINSQVIQQQQKFKKKINTHLNLNLKFINKLSSASFVC